MTSGLRLTVEIREAIRQYNQERAARFALGVIPQPVLPVCRAFAEALGISDCQVAEYPYTGIEHWKDRSHELIPLLMRGVYVPLRILERVALPVVQFAPRLNQMSELAQACYMLEMALELECLREHVFDKAPRLRNLAKQVAANGLANIFVVDGTMIFLALPLQMITGPFRNRTLLHNDGGPALVTSREQFYFWRGVQMEPWMVTISPDDIDGVAVLSITNVDQRAAMIQRIGWERIVSKKTANLLDEEALSIGGKLVRYELYRMLLPKRTSYSWEQDREECILKMENPSVPGLWHAEFVPQDMLTVLDALAWRNQTERGELPEQIA